MDSQGNLVNGNPMALNKYIFQVMYPNKYYIFGIIEEYYDELECSWVYQNIMDPQGNLEKGNPRALSMYIFHLMYPNKC